MAYPKRTGSTKICVACGKEKDLQLFFSYKRKCGTMGYTSRCRECHLQYCRDRNKSDRGKEVYKKWTQSESGKISIKKRSKTFVENHPDRYKANYLSRNARRDKRLVPQPCRICGSFPTEGHHVSYDKPLEVDWLCKKCHLNLHYPSRLP